MELIERAVYLLFGGAIGFVLGFIVARLNDIKEEVDQVLDIEHHRDDRGITRLHPIVLNVVLFGVVIMVAWSAWASARISDRVEDNQARIAKIGLCNQKSLNETVVALGERTDYTLEQTQANVAVQTAQAEFFLGIYENPADDELELRLFNEYANALEEFVKASSDVEDTSKEFPYPTPQEIRDCLEE